MLEDLRSLCRAAQAYGDQHADDATLTGFLEQAAGLHAHEIAPGEPDRRITVSTIHRSEGHGGAARRPAGLRGAAAAVLARAAITRRRAAGRGAPPVLRRLHPRQGPADPHPCRHPRRPPHRRTVPLPHRSRADRPSPGARRLTTKPQVRSNQHAQPQPPTPPTSAATAPARTHARGRRAAAPPVRAQARSAFAR